MVGARALRFAGTRQLALEFILVLCERKPSWMRATATLADRTLRSILMLMTETDDDPEWHSANEARASVPPSSFICRRSESGVRGLIRWAVRVVRTSQIIQDDQDANSLVAEQGLDRFARAIRTKLENQNGG